VWCGTACPRPSMAQQSNRREVLSGARGSGCGGRASAGGGDRAQLRRLEAESAPHRGDNGTVVAHAAHRGRLAAPPGAPGSSRRAALWGRTDLLRQWLLGDAVRHPRAKRRGDIRRIGRACGGFRCSGGPPRRADGSPSPTDRSPGPTDHAPWLGLPSWPRRASDSPSGRALTAPRATRSVAFVGGRQARVDVPSEEFVVFEMWPGRSRSPAGRRRST
jgi:hypothetical protein